MVDARGVLDGLVCGGLYVEQQRLKFGLPFRLFDIYRLVPASASVSLPCLS